MITHDDLKWYKKTPRQIFWSWHKKYSPVFPDSFKISYTPKLIEQYWVEERLYTELLK